MKIFLCVLVVVVFGYSQKAMDVKELQKLFPETIGEYVYDQQENAGMLSHGYSFSFVEKNYTKNQIHLLSLRVMDYKTAQPMFQSVTHMWSSQFQLKTNEQTVGPFVYNEFKGWKSIFHTEKKVHLMLAAHNRYLISVEIEQTEDLQHAKQILKQFNYTILEK